MTEQKEACTSNSIYVCSDCEEDENYVTRGQEFIQQRRLLNDKAIHRESFPDNYVDPDYLLRTSLKSDYYNQMTALNRSKWHVKKPWVSIPCHRDKREIKMIYERRNLYYFSDTDSDEDDEIDTGSANKFLVPQETAENNELEISGITTADEAEEVDLELGYIQLLRPNLMYPRTLHEENYFKYLWNRAKRFIHYIFALIPNMNNFWMRIIFLLCANSLWFFQNDVIHDNSNNLRSTYDFSENYSNVMCSYDINIELCDIRSDDFDVLFIFIIVFLLVLASGILLTVFYFGLKNHFHTDEEEIGIENIDSEMSDLEGDSEMTNDIERYDKGVAPMIFIKNMDSASKEPESNMGLPADLKEAAEVELELEEVNELLAEEDMLDLLEVVGEIEVPEPEEQEIAEAEEMENTDEDEETSDEDDSEYVEETSDDEENNNNDEGDKQE